MKEMRLFSNGGEREFDVKMVFRGSGGFYRGVSSGRRVVGTGSCPGIRVAIIELPAM